MRVIWPDGGPCRAALLATGDGGCNLPQLVIRHHQLFCLDSKSTSGSGNTAVTHSSVLLFEKIQVSNIPLTGLPACSLSSPTTVILSLSNDSHDPFILPFSANQMVCYDVYDPIRHRKFLRQHQQDATSCMSYAINLSQPHHSLASRSLC